MCSYFLTKCAVILFLPSVLALFSRSLVSSVDVREPNTSYWLRYLRWSPKYWGRVGIAKE